jgi:hypothetical protein
MNKMNIELTKDEGLMLMGYVSARQCDDKEVSAMLHKVFVQLNKQRKEVA